jgi:RNA polymerase sigma-70 factor (ECF subfamily)
VQRAAALWGHPGYLSALGECQPQGCNQSRRVAATIAHTPMASSLAGFAHHERPVRDVTRCMPHEEQAIARAAGGDTEAFREIYERHRRDVARLVYRMIGPRSDQDDVIQEVFVQVYKSLKDFRGQSKFSTWLHRVTVNVVLMHRRAARSRPVFAPEPPVDAAARSEDIPPDEGVERRERMRAFGRLLDRLADKKRIVFVLHELEGVPPGEIAVIVGAPVLTVRTRLFYARRELEAMLAEEPSLAGMQLTFSKISGAGGEP